MQVAALPAGLYCMQNIAILLSLQNLDGVTFNILNQTKTLSAALCCYLIMGRKQSKLQILSLFQLLVSTLIIEKILPINIFFSKSNNDEVVENILIENPHSSHHFTHGVLPVIGASFLSGLAGAISQKNLQGAYNRNAYLFTMELCAASTFILVGSLFLSDDGSQIKENGFFDQWTFYTLIPIIVNSLGGILVGLVTKYAGSVRKGFALIFGILISGMIAAFVKDDSKDEGLMEKVIGGFLVALSLWMHAVNPFVEHSSDKKIVFLESPSKNDVEIISTSKRRKSFKED